MTTPRRVFSALLAVLSLVVLTAGGAWLVVDDATLLGWLVKRVESVSGTRISYRADAAITRTLSPVLQLNGLVVEDIEGKYRVETRSLSMQLNLPYLLVGRVDIPRLFIGDTSVNINRTDPAREAGSPVAVDLSVLRLKPVLHDVRVSEISLLIEGDKLRLPAREISELALRLEAGKDVPQFTAQLDIEGEKLTVDVTLPELHEALKREQLPFSVVVKGELADSSAVGQIDFSHPDAVIDATLHILVPDLTKLPVAVEGLEIPGELVATGRLAGAFSKPALEDLSMTWNGPARSTATLTGRVAHVADFSGVDLDLGGRLDRGNWLQPLLPESMGPLDTAELAVRISGSASKLDLHDFSARATTGDGLDLSLTGQLAVTSLFSAPQPENIKLDLGFNAPTTHAVRALLFDEIPELGAVRASAEVRSTRGDPRLDNIAIRTKDKAGITASIEGSIAQFPLDADKPNAGYALDTVIKAAQTSLIAERVGLDLPLEGPLELVFRIEGDTEALQLNQVRLSAGRDDKTFIGAKGRLDFRDWEKKDPLNSIDLAIELKGRDTGFLRAWTEQDLPETAYSARGRLHTVAGRHRFDDYVQNTPAGEPLNISETGSVDQVIFFPEFDLQGINVDVKASTNNIATLNTLFSLDDRIPAIGPLKLSFNYSGTDEKLFLRDFSLTAGQPDIMLVTAKGHLGYISAARKWRLEDTDLAVHARSTSSQAFAKSLGVKLPQLGAVSAAASLNDKDKMLGLRSLRLSVGDSSAPVLTADGYIGNVYSASQVRLDVKLNLGGNHLAAFADKEALPGLKPVTGSMVISDSNGTLGMDSLQVESSSPGLLAIKVDGSYDDFADPETLLLNSELKARDLQLLGALFDQQWSKVGPVEFNAVVKKAGKDAVLNASLVLEKAAADIKLRGDFDRTPPYINGAITARNVFFKDPIDKAAEERKAQQKAKDKKKKRKKKKSDKEKKIPVFSRDPLPFHWLKKADLDLTVDVDSFDQDGWDAQSAKAVIALKSGRFVARPVTFVYSKGTLDTEFELDAGDTPGLLLKAVAKNVNPYRGESGEAGYERYVKTDVDLDLFFKAAGESAHELASSANGHVYLTIQDGRLRRSLVDLLFVDLVGWSLNMVKDSKYAPINCGVADYSINKGVVSTDAFFIDAKSITVTGEGAVDLGREEVDYVFIPRKKSRLVLKAEPVKVKGPLNDPSVKAIPVKSAALTFGTLIFAPYVFAGMVAADFASDAVQKGNDGKSACVEYKELRRKMREEQGKAAP
ncbi:MAG: AsmA-like C-terminal region-containing protein [Thiogranum sp.]